MVDRKRKSEESMYVVSGREKESVCEERGKWRK